MVRIPSFQGGTIASALRATDASARLKAALFAGTYPDAELLPTLIDRCAMEPDFFVRDMLTWALIQLPRDATIPALRQQLGSDNPQPRSQVLHTLSKLTVPEAWSWVFPELVRDADDEVARAAWRVAVDIVPQTAQAALVAVLLDQLGRGDLEVKKSLAWALVALAVICGDVVPLLRAVSEAGRPDAAAHARAALRLIGDPGASFAALAREASASDQTY